MTERIRLLKEWQWERKHHAYRRDVAVPTDTYRRAELRDDMRSALRLKAALEHEIPVLAPQELIAGTRTLRELPMIYDDVDWKTICDTHFIHERGNISNLSPDYARVLGKGLLALRAELGDAPCHQAMRVSIDAVLNFAGRYRDHAQREGHERLAQILARVPAYPAQTFHEALQSLRILHYAMWCEGDYHNTLGRFDQYMMPYLQRDLDEGGRAKRAPLNCWKRSSSPATGTAICTPGCSRAITVRASCWEA